MLHFEIILTLSILKLKSFLLLILYYYTQITKDIFSETPELFNITYYSINHNFKLYFLSIFYLKYQCIKVQYILDKLKIKVL